MQQERVPSSHGSLGGEDGEGDAAEHGRHAADPLDAGSDGFDSEEFREFLRQRNERRTGTRGGGARRGSQQPRRRELDDSDDDRSGGTAGKGAGGQPPEWDGSTSFQDWLIKAKLWLATTRARPKTQGPLILQRLSGPAFQAFKHWARDADWLQDDRGGFKLLDAMNGPDQFGEDKEEDLLASLAKITYHLRRGKDEGLRTFFARWDESLRKVREHSVVLPDKYLGFLLINALNLSDQEIKGMLTFTRGSIIPAEVKSWARKHEMKLNAKDIGIEKDRKSTSGSSKVGSGNVHYMAEDDDADEEILMMEDALQELRDEDGQEEEPLEADGSILDEHEVAEILNTMVQKKRTFMQSLKTKKAKELSRGFGNWKGGGKGYAASGPGASSSRASNSLHATGRLKSGFYKMSLEEMKANSRCSKCLQVGHWHKDAICPKNQRGGKEAHYIEKNDEKEINSVELDEAIFCGWMEGDDSADREVMSPNTLEKNLAFCRDDDEQDAGERSAVFDDGTELTPVQPVGSSAADFNDMYSEGDYKTGYRSDVVVDRFFEGHHKGCVCVCLSPGEKEILWNRTDGSVRQPDSPNDLLCGTIDTGCQRMAIGSETLRQFSLLLPPELNIGTMKQEFQFRSVHGRSKTTQVATIPTSLGTNGSILKPAIFTGENSENAPFLISLPFLLSCRTVLHLDPSCGLRAEFKKLGFSVKCHVGPTGALRIPLGEFSNHQKRKVSDMMKKISNSSSEFEILKTSMFESRSAEKGSIDNSPKSSPDTVESDDVQRQRRRQEEQAIRTGANSEPSGLGESRGQDALPDVSDDRAIAQPVRAQNAEGGSKSGSQTQPDSEDLLGNSTGRWQLGHRDGQLRDDRHGHANVTGVYTGERTSGSTYTEPDVIATDLGRSIPGRGAGEDLRPTSIVQPQSAVQAVHVPQAGCQSTPDVLAMSGTPSTSMPDVPVDTVPTPLVGRTLLVSVKDTQHDGIPAGAQRGEEPARRRWIGDMPTPDHHTSRDKCSCPEGEVQALQQAIDRPQEDARGDAQRQEGDLRGGAGREGLGGVCGVQEVPSLAEDAGAIVEQPKLEEEELEAIRSLVLERPRAQKRMERVVRQASTALECAEAMWHEVMSLLKVQEQSVEQTGWDRWSAATVSNSTKGKITYSRSNQTYQNLYGLDAKQMKTVAEIYNPNRFKGETERQGLIHGSAFDLELGHDLLQPETQAEVESYVTRVKPGLVVISPICTMWSLMQNMNQKHLNDPFKMKAYLKRLREAKELLRFGVKIAKVVRDYGGVFLIEQPLTSKAWQCDELYRLLQEEDVHMVRGDQCMYGLTDLSGNPQLKPTGWCSNSEILLQHLDRKCDRQHSHSHILGSEKGELKSKRAQIYPAALVQAIIASYKKHLKDEFLYVEITKVDQLTQDLRRRQRLMAEMHVQDPEAELLAAELLAVNAEDGRDLAEPEAMDENDEKYQWMPRERPFSLKSLVKRAHDGLGHPSNERLARILKGAGASDEAVTLAKKLECECCRRHQLTKAPRAAAPPRHYHVNQVVGVDTVWLPTPSGKQRMALNIVLALLSGLFSFFLIFFAWGCL